MITGLIRKVERIEVFRYAVAGAIATAAEWGTFYLLAVAADVYYQFGVAISLVTGAATNYLVNKTYTFKNKSREIVSQFTLHLGVSAFSWSVHMGVMFVLVDLISVDKMLSKVVATAIMLLPNYVMYKYTVFNPQFFGGGETQGR